MSEEKFSTIPSRLSSTKGSLPLSTEKSRDLSSFTDNLNTNTNLNTNNNNITELNLKFTKEDKSFTLDINLYDKIIKLTLNGKDNQLDLSEIRKLINLEILTLRGFSNLTSLSFLDKSKKLTELYCDSIELKDISALGRCP